MSESARFFPELGVGLICGFTLTGGEPPTPLDERVVAATLAEGKLPVWLHFNLADSRARNFLGSLERLPKRARDLLLGTDPHIRLEVSEDVVAGILSDFNTDFGDDPESLDEFRVALGPGLLITVRRHPLKSMDRVRHELEEGLQIAGTVGLFRHLVQLFAEQVRSIVEAHSDKVDDLEDKILVDKIEDIGDQLGPMRRMLARIRRRLGAQRQVLQRILPRPPAWFAESDIALFRETLEHLDAISQDLDLVAERARLLQEEFAGRLSEETSRNLYFLSVVTAVILPVTLITGIFGMNVPGLPWLMDENGFWWVAGVMVVTLLVTAIFLRRRRLF